MKAHTIVSKLERNTTTTQNMVSEIHRTVVGARGAGGGKDSSVSDTRTLVVTELLLTIAQTQTRLAI